MTTNKTTYTWGTFEFHAPEGKEVFYATQWYHGALGKTKHHDPNEEFECLYRIVDTSHKITRQKEKSSDTSTDTDTHSCQKTGLKAEKSHISTNLKAVSQATMGSPEVIPTPAPKDKLLELVSLQRIRSDNPRLTIAFDSEFFYESSGVEIKYPDPDDNKAPKKIQAEDGPRQITSYQFALYLADEIHVLEVVFLVKPIVKKNGTVVYKRLTLSQCLGAILDLMTFQKKNHVFDYKDTRRWGFKIDSKDVSKVKDLAGCEIRKLKFDPSKTEVLFKSSEEAFAAVGTLKESYADCAIDTSNVPKDAYKNTYGDYKGDNAIKITILCHAGGADLSAFAPERIGKKDKKMSLLTLTSSIQGGLVSMEEHFFRANHKDYWKFYPCMVEFRDTMCYTVPDKKKLKALGESIGVPKIELPEGVISKMGEFLKTNRVEYLEYAANDALITLCYGSQMWGINREMPVTASSAAARGAYESIKEYMGLDTKADFQLAYGGLKKVVKGKSPNANLLGYTEESNLEAYDHRAFLLLRAAEFSYKGGYNGCTRVGWFDSEQYYDYDLKNAYPTSMCSVFDIDFHDGVDPLQYDPICKRELTLDDFEHPYDPMFAYISFEFPIETKFPCIPIGHEGSLVFPRTSDGFEGVYACGPEIYLALKMGAKIFCHDGYRGRVRRREDGTPSRSLSEAVFQFVQDRVAARQLFGDKSIEELILKIMVNAIYGKTAQYVIPKHSWSGRTQDYEEIGMSIITSPVHAAITTAGVRCVLIAAMTQLEELGFRVWSVTTDGFISNAPMDVLAGLDLFGFADVFKSARLYLTKGESDAMWEAKHTMNRFLNLATRANVCPDKGGVCAHGGLNTGKKHDSLEDRAFFIEKALAREKAVPSYYEEFVNLKTMITKPSDFHTYKCVTNINFDFDMKRKPVKESLHSVWVNPTDYQSYPTEHEGCYEMACVDTVPFESIAEYEHYREVKKNRTVLRTSENWKLFFLKVDSPKELKKRVTNVAWTELMSCLIAYRAGLVTIEPLDACKTLQEKADYINAHNRSGKEVTTNCLKNAGRPDKVNKMLPLDQIQDTLLLLQGKKIA